MSAVESGVRVTDAWTAAISSATVAAGRCAAAMAPWASAPAAKKSGKITPPGQPAPAARAIAASFAAPSPRPKGAAARGPWSATG